MVSFLALAISSRLGSLLGESYDDNDDDDDVGDDVRRYVLSYVYFVVSSPPLALASVWFGRLFLGYLVS